MQGVHYLASHGTTVGVCLDICHGVPLLAIVVCLSRRQLECAEGSAIYVALHLQYPRYELAIGGKHAHTPAGHIVTLGHGVELYATILCPLYLQDAQFLALVEDEGVGVVVHDDYVVLLGKAHQSFVGLHLCLTTRGHIGIVCPHQFYAREVHLLKLLEVGLPTVALQQVVVYNPCPKQLAQRGVGGITRVGHQHTIARVYEGESDV